MASTDALVDVVVEGFQIDVGGIEVRQQVGKRFWTDVPC
jgi:hypothetical protein